MPPNNRNYKSCLKYERIEIDIRAISMGAAFSRRPNQLTLISGIIDVAMLIRDLAMDDGSLLRNGCHLRHEYVPLHLWNLASRFSQRKRRVVWINHAAKHSHKNIE